MTMNATMTIPVRHAHAGLLRPHLRSTCSIMARSSSTSTGMHLEQAPNAPGQRRAAVSKKHRTLALLPLSHVLRSYLIMALSSSPVMFRSLSWMIQRMLKSKLAFLDPDRNGILNWVLRRTFYDQFCAGENQQQVKRTLDSLHAVGYNGAILEYGAELVDGQQSAVSDEQAIRAWRDGLLQSVEVANTGDFIGLK